MECIREAQSNNTMNDERANR